MQTSDLLPQVIDALVSVTRYPKEVLAPDADLENDLGIDSVKLVEILVSLGREFHIDLMKQERDPAIRTIQQVARWIAELLAPSNLDNKQVAHSAYKAPESFNRPGNSALQASDGASVVSREYQVKSNLGSVKQNPSGQSSHTNPTYGHSSNGHSSNGHSSNGHSSNGHSSNGHSSNGNSVNEHSLSDQRLPLRKANGATAKFSPAHTTPPSTHSPGPARKVPHNGDANMPQQTQVLNGRVALVTGSGRGVGRTIARLLAKRGATVIINSFHSRDAGDRTAAEINAQGGRATHLWGSIANPGHVDNIFDEITDRVGQLDILVCNASDGRIGSFATVSPEDWERAFRTNVIGHYQCAMRASRLMQQQGGGVIVTMSSIAARRYVEGLGGQGVVKAAVESMTRHLACELAPYGIRANCVSGGPVYGQVMSMYSEARSTMNYWETLVLDGELCSPLDLAYTVGFLVSDEARGVNGAVWNVDHGLSTRSHSRPLPKAMVDQSSISASS